MVGVIIAAIATFGNFYFSKKVEEEANKPDFVITSPSRPEQQYKEVLLKIDSHKNFISFSFISSGHNKWFIKDIYIELIRFREERVVEYGLSMYLGNMGSFSKMGEYSIQLDTNYKYYPLSPLSFSQEENTWVFQDTDMENMSIAFDYYSGEEFVIRLCSNIVDAKSNKKNIVCSEELSFYKRKAKHGDKIVFTNWKQPKMKIFGESIEKNLYKLLINGNPDFLSSFDKNLINNKFKKDLLHILKNEKPLRIRREESPLGFRRKAEYIIGQLEISDIAPYNITLYKILTLRHKDFFGKTRAGIIEFSLTNKDLISKIQKKEITKDIKEDIKKILLKGSDGFYYYIVKDIVLHFNIVDLYPYIKD
jgi:hypothetical protein